MQARLLLVAVAFVALAGTARAAQVPTCSLTRSGETITDTLTGVRTSGGTFFWNIAVLDGPTGQQLWYFRAGPSTFTAPFAYEGPGEYVGEFWTTVDNNRGPAKFTHLSTRCSLTVL